MAKLTKSGIEKLRKFIIAYQELCAEHGCTIGYDAHLELMYASSATADDAYHPSLQRATEEAHNLKPGELNRIDYSI